MYTTTQFNDRSITAISVPPPYNSTLNKDFQELGRIHFYLGHTPIDFMIKAVEEASLQDIEKGKLQILFAVKEIQDFVSGSYQSISAFNEEKLNPSLYFDKSFKKILDHTLEVLDEVYKSPAAKENFSKVETMIQLTHEVKIFSKSLKGIDIKSKSITKKINEIKNKYQSIHGLKTHYENLSGLKDFVDYEDQTKESVIKQLKQPYEFDYASLLKIHYHQDDWMYIVRSTLDQQKDINKKDYKSNLKEAQKLKDDFLKQIKSFNRLLENGVVNHVLSHAMAINREIFLVSEKSKVSAQDYFNRELNYHKKSLDKMYGNKDYHQKEIEKLESVKEDFIQRKVDDKTFYNEYLTLLHRQEKNIIYALNKLRANILNTKVKEVITFYGNINEGFVIGQFSNSDQIMLIHKDKYVEVPEAVYAMIVSKEKYEDAIKNKRLIFDEDLRTNFPDNASNFWSYGQLLQELTDPEIQKFFLGQEFDLVDKTDLIESKKAKLK